MPLRRHHVVCLLCALSLAHSQPTPPLTASSEYGDPRYLTRFALDGNPRSRWASRPGVSPVSIVIDLGQTITLRELTVVWERAMATEYDVQTSSDGNAWRTAVTRTDPDGKRFRVGPDTFTDRLTGFAAQGRYLRILCRKPGQHNLYSIWEIQFPQPEIAALVRKQMATYEEKHLAALRARRQEALRIFARHGIEKLVFAVREDGVDGHWYANFGYYAPDANRKCYRAGGRLCLLNVADNAVRTLVGDPEGSIRDPAVHYDGQRIVFSWRKSGTEHFHLYEIRADGTGLHQLTDGGGDYDDIEPTYLPDGGIAFVSSRCRRWVNCWLTQVGVIYRCEADGSDIQRLSANIEHDNTPWPLPDGRLIYQRWEYIDRSQVHYHHLWTMNPDGTGQMVYFGNMHGGGVFIDAKPVPGSDEVVLILSPGHGQREHTGSVALLTPKRGPDCQPSMRRLTDGGFRDPYAIEAGWFLAAKGRAMYLVGRERQLIEFFSLPDGLSPGSLQEPRPLVAHQRERLIPPRTDARKPTGELVLHDIYQGRNMTGVERGEIKQLLVLEALPKPINFTGGMEPLSYGGTFTLERIVGTVPVETDGSAHLSLPANRALFLVALDSQGRSVKRMQSFLTVRPGETTSCVGCHEARTQAPANLTGRAGRSLASRRAPSTPIHVPGVPEVLDYPRDVQPVLDRHCVRCHKPDRRSGGVLLTGDRGPLYSHSYFMLSARQQIADGRNLARSNYPPRALGDSGSALMDKLASGRHHGVQAPEADLRIVRYWLNSGAAYPGTYAALGTGMVGGYAQNQIDRQDLDWPEMKAAMGVLDRRCMSCHADAHRPLPQSPSDNGGMPPWAIHYASPRLKLSRHIVYNLSRPEKSVLLLAPLARKAGGYAMQKRDKEGMPVGDPIEVFATNEDPDFQTLLRSIQRTKQRLDTIGRFDMPGFAPSPAYLREMRRYGLLGKDETPVGAQIYELERRYWESFAYHPTP